MKFNFGKNIAKLLSLTLAIASLSTVAFAAPADDAVADVIDVEQVIELTNGDTPGDTGDTSAAQQESNVLNIDSIKVTGVKDASDKVLSYTATLKYSFKSGAPDNKQVALIGYTFGTTPESDAMAGAPTDGNAIYAVDQDDAKASGEFVINLTTDATKGKAVDANTILVLKIGSDAVDANGAQCTPAAAVIKLADADLQSSFEAKTAKADVEQLNLEYGADVNAALNELATVTASAVNGEQKVAGFATEGWAIKDGAAWNGAIGAENIFVGKLVQDADKGVTFAADFNDAVEVKVVINALTDGNITVTTKDTEILVGTDLSGKSADEFIQNIEIANADGTVTDTYKANGTGITFDPATLPATTAAGEHTIKVIITGASDKGYFNLATAVEKEFKLTIVDKPAGILGDANDDSRVNGLDAIAIQRFVKFETAPARLDLSDVNGDSRVNGLDAIAIQRFVKFETPF